MNFEDEPNFKIMRSFAPGERDAIKDCLERARMARKVNR